MLGRVLTTVVMTALAGCASRDGHVGAASVGAAADADGATAADGPNGDVTRGGAPDGATGGGVDAGGSTCVPARLVDAGVGEFVVGRDAFYWLIHAGSVPSQGLFEAPKRGGTPTLVAPSVANMYSGSVTMAVDRDVVYYSVGGGYDPQTGGRGLICRVTPDGATTILLSDDPALYFISRVIVDGGELFYSGRNYCTAPYTSCTSAIGARPTAGGVERIVARTPNIVAMQIVGDAIYFTDSSLRGIFRVAKSGGTPQLVATLETDWPELLYVADGFAYVGDHYSGTVARAMLDGGAAAVIWTAPTSSTRLNAIAAAGGRVFIGASDGLLVVNSDGSGATRLLDSWVGAIALDGSDMYAAGDGIRRFCP